MNFFFNIVIWDGFSVFGFVIMMRVVFFSRRLFFRVVRNFIMLLKLFFRIRYLSLFIMMIVFLLVFLMSLWSIVGRWRGFMVFLLGILLS